MPEITLVAWIVTAAGGLTLTVLWLARGGADQAQDEGEVAERRKGVGRGATPPTPAPADGRPAEPPEPPGVSLNRVIPHAALAVAGLLLWTGYVVRQEEPGMRLVPLLALLILLVVAGFGLAMFLRWRVSRRTDHPARDADRRLPVVLVALHGIAAVVTLVLVVVVWVQETVPLLRDAFAGTRDPELETLGWLAVWTGIGVVVGVILHFAFGSRRERRTPGGTILLTTMAAVVGGAIAYFLLGLSGAATIVVALVAALLSSWGRTFGYAVPSDGAA